MYNQNQGQQMQNQGNPNMNPKFMMQNQPPQNMMMFSQGMNRVGMLPKPELPLHLQVLFAPRMPLVYVKPPEKHRCRSFDPMIRQDFDFMSIFEDEDPPEKVIIESRTEIKEKKEKQKMEDYKNKINEGLNQWNPIEDPKCTGDPMKTLFVARISFETSEKKLKKEFEVYGPVKKVRLIKNITNNKARGYAFIEFEHKKDFITAYKQADGKKIDDKRVLVDCERGRTVKGWRPRRFGGGKGETRRTRSAQKERAGNDKKKSKSRSRDNKKRTSRSETNKMRSRSREKSRERKKPDFNRERDRERERGGDRDRGDRTKDRDRDRKDFRDRRNDYEKDKKERDRGDREKKNPRMEKEQQQPLKKEKKEIPSKMEDEGELLSGEIEKKKKKKKGKEKDRSREKKRSKSPKEKKHKRPNDRKNEKDDDKMKMEIENSNLAYEKKEMGEIRSEDM